MPPSPTPEEQEIIDGHKVKLQKTIDGLNIALAEINDNSIPNNDEHEVLNKKFYDFYHIDVITNYEIEIEAMNGVYIPSPIVEQDLIDRSKQEGRLFDEFRQIPDVIRVPEFDGGNSSTKTDNEQYRINRHQFWRDRLEDGLLTSETFDEDTSESIAPGQTQLTIDPGVQVGSDWDNISIGEEFIVTDGNDSFVGKVTGLTNPIPLVAVGFCTDEDTPPKLDQASCELDNGTWTPPSPPFGGIIEFSYVTGPLTSSVGSGASVKFTWNGFNNTERIGKSSSNYQDVMDEWIDELDQSVAGHLAYLNTQKTAIENNLEDDVTAIANNADALDNVNTAISDYTNYKSTLLISDAGFTTLNSLNSNRSSELTARIAEAGSQKSSFYDLRFFWTEQRAGAKGTLIKAEDLVRSISAINGIKANNQAQLDGFDDQNL